MWSPIRGRRSLGACVAAAVVAVSAATMAVTSVDRHREAVLNPSAVVDTSNWHSGSDATEVKLSRVKVQDGPRGATTALHLRRAGGGGDYSYALAGLDAAQGFFEPGQSYRMSAWVRDRRATGRAIGMLLSNSNFEHRPTEEQQEGRYTDTSWHLLQRTFVADEGARADTGLYFFLPTVGALSWDVTRASVQEVTPPEPPVVRDPDTRVLTFDGERGAPPDPASWTSELGGAWGDGELQTYTSAPANAQLDGGGHLVLTARQERLRGVDGITRDYTSARLTTAGKVPVEPGSYVEASVRVSTGAGIAPAFWLLGSDTDTRGWPASGELDIMEATQRSDRTVRQALHTASVDDPTVDVPYGEYARGGYTDLSTRRDEAFHRFGVYFDDDLVQFYVDGEATLKLTREEALERRRAWPFGRPQDIILTIAVTSEPAERDLPAAMEVASLRIAKGGVPRSDTFGIDPDG